MTDRFSDTFIRPSGQGMSNFSLAAPTNTQTDLQDKKDQSQQDKDNEKWQQDAEEYFNDFISIDEEKISVALARLEEKRFKKRRKGKDNKQSSSEQKKRREDIEKQTLLVSEAFKDITFSPEELAQKKQLSQECLKELKKLVNKLCPEIHLYFDLFSYDSLALLKANGFQDKIIMNIVFIHYFANDDSGVIDTQQYLYFQIFLFYLNISLTVTEIQNYITSHFNEPQQFEKITQQLIRYIKLNARCFQSIEAELIIRMEHVLPYFLKQIKRSKLDLSKKLAVRNLEHQLIKLRTKINRVNKQIERLLSKKQSIFNYLGENDGLLLQWKETEYNVCCIFILYYLLNEGFPLTTSRLYKHLKSLGVRLKHPEIIERLKGFSLEELGKLQLLSQQDSNTIKKPEYTLIDPKQLNYNQLTHDDLQSDEQWILYKTQQIESIKGIVHRIHLQHYQALLNKS